MRNNEGFFSLLSSLEKNNSKKVSPTDSSYTRELTPMMAFLRERVRSDGNDLQYSISDDLLADLKSRYNPKNMNFDDLENLLDELIENGIITQEDKECMMTVPIFLGTMDSKYAGEVGLAASGTLLDTLDQNIDAMGMQLSWTQTEGFTEGFTVMSANRDPLTVATDTLNFLSHNMTLRNLLTKLC